MGIGVNFPGCTRTECTRQSKKFGSSYQKCHCEIKQANGSKVLIHHVSTTDLQDQWMDKTDTRIVIDKDEKWCAHGRICNHAVRGHICKHGGNCRFCHDSACAAAVSRGSR